MIPNPSEPQTPAGEQIFLDHVGWFVPEMDAASAAFERLGLPMSPFTVHTNEQPDGSRKPSGTANRCAMIARGYLEVLVRMPDMDSSLTRQIDAGLKRYTGLHLIAFTVADTEATTAWLREAGYNPAPPVPLRRDMTLDDGSEGVAAFSVVRLPADEMEEGRVQVLSQDTPEIVWQPSITADENALDLLSGILICSGDPADAAERYARFTGRAAAETGAGYRIALDRGEIGICGADGCAAILPGMSVPSLPFMAAVAIRSADLDRTRSYLSENGVALLDDTPDRLVVHPDEGMGAAFVFHSADRPPFEVS